MNMIDKYKDKIIDSIWKEFKWENDSHFQNILFKGEDNIDKEDLLERTENYIPFYAPYSMYVQGLLLLFGFHDRYNEEIKNKKEEIESKKVLFYNFDFNNDNVDSHETVPYEEIKKIREIKKIIESQKELDLRNNIDKDKPYLIQIVPNEKNKKIENIIKQIESNKEMKLKIKNEDKEIVDITEVVPKDEIEKIKEIRNIKKIIEIFESEKAQDLKNNIDKDRDDLIEIVPVEEIIEIENNIKQIEEIEEIERIEKEEYDLKEIYQKLEKINNVDEKNLIHFFRDLKNLFEKYPEQMKLLHCLYTEVCIFSLLCNELYSYHVYQSQKLIDYDIKKLNKLKLRGIDINQIIQNTIKGLYSLNSVNLLENVDVSTQSSKDESRGIVFDNVFKRFKQCTIPFSDNFIKDVKTTSREMAFQMMLRMIRHFTNKRIDPNDKKVNRLLWGENTPFHPLFEMLSKNSEELERIVKKDSYDWDWKSLYNLLLPLDEKKYIIPIKKEPKYEIKKEPKYEIEEPEVLITEGIEGTDFCRILKTKYYDNDRSEKYLYECLQKLYEILSSEGCFKEPCKEAFVYRLSGFNKPQDLVINWVGSNAFLGRIIRCLYEDNFQQPPYKKIAEFMGLANKNLAAAKYIKRGKNARIVIDLLEDCGFKNVKVFEALKHDWSKLI